MAIDQVTNQSTFAEWKDITNNISADLGDVQNLPTTDKSNLVASMVEVENRVDALEAGGANQNIYETISGDTGSTTADTTTDTLTVSGGDGISTAVSADTLTITNDDRGSAAITTHESTYDHAAYDSHVGDTANPHSVTASQVGSYTQAESDAAFEPKRLNNLTAIVDPTVNDDSGSGYSTLSLWYNTATEEVYRAVDVTVGAAVWVLTSLTVDDLGALATVDNASGVPYNNATSGLTATDVQAAVDEVEGRVDTLETNNTGTNTGDQNAAGVSYSNTTSGLTATDTQAAIDEVEGRVDTLETNNTGTNTGDQTAAGVDVTPTGNLTSTTVQAALQELQGDIDAISDTDDQTAAEVSYNNITSGLTATDVQAAVDEVEGRVDTLETNNTGTNTGDQNATGVSYSNTTSGLTATDVQAAVDEVEGRVDTLETNNTGTNTGDQNAAGVSYSNTTSGLTATDTQAAIDEVEGRVDTLETNNTGTNTGDQVAADVNITDVGAYYTGTEVEAALQEIGSDINTLQTNNTGTNTGDQNLFESVAGDTGSTTADIATDTLTVAGGTGISTAVSGDTLTVTNDDTGSSAVTTHESTYDHAAYDSHLDIHPSGSAGSITTTASDVYTFPLATYRTAKFVVSATDGTPDYEAREILVTHDGTNAYISVGTALTNGGSLVITYTADINTGNVRLRAATNAGTATIKFDVTLIPV